MALAFRSNDMTINSTAGTSNVVTAPAGIVDNDILIFMLDRAVTNDGITLSGFTQLFSSGHDGGGLYASWKRASSESGNYTASWTASSRNVAIMYAISGAIIASTPVIAGGTVFGSGTTPDPPSADPGSSGNRFAIAFFGQEGKNGSASPPSGYTEPGSNSDGYTIGGGAATGHCGCVAAHRIYTGQAEDPGTFSLALNDGWAAQTLVFTEEPAGTSEGEIAATVQQYESPAAFRSPPRKVSY